MLVIAAAIPAPRRPLEVGAPSGSCTAVLGRLACMREHGHVHGHVFDAGDVLDGRHDD